jgi:hypothetical protein
MVFKPRSEAPHYQIQDGDTLKAIAAKHSIPYKTLVLYNWGTDEKAVVKRALIEAIGVSGPIDDPELYKFSGDERNVGSGEVAIPKEWKKPACTLDKQYTLKLKKNTPATAVAVTALDKWFIPKVEACDLTYCLEGVKEHADKLALEVYGSNYCGCSEWNKGLGKFDEKLPDEPVYTEDLAKQALPRKKPYGLPEKWSGKATTEKGFFSVKVKKDRFINTAFSPYTIHLRYFKADGDKTARIDLKPFWPQFDETKAEPAVTTTVGATIKMKWTNAKAVCRGVLMVHDKNGQQVYFKRLDGDQLKKGAVESVWDKKYRTGAMDSLFKGIYNAEPDAGKNKDAPYTYKVTTYTRKPKQDSLKVQWEIKNSDKLKLGLLQIFDGKDRLVFQSGLKESDHLKKGAHTYPWKGNYNQGVKNSKKGDAVIYEDMPYRAQLQAHTPAGESEGLALAAMHTEVRLYVDPKTCAPQDLLYDSWDTASSMLLSTGPLVPGDPPAEADGTKWFRYQLAEAGFHPGPVTDAAAANSSYKIALKEFKRSIPKDGAAGGKRYARLTIDENENAETKAAIKSLRDSNAYRDKRKWFGDLGRVNSNNDNPDLTTAEIKTKLPDASQDVIVWVDDRQYYTAGKGKDENNRNYLSGTADANTFGLMNYRGAMDIADNKTTRDAASIPRPWIPLTAEPRLVSRTKGLYDSAALAVSDDQKAAMLAAIGPLRMDWTFDELPPDVSTVDTTAYHRNYTRSRTYLWWALHKYKATYTRKDTKRAAVYTNCRKDLGGIRPQLDGELNSYYQKAFGCDTLNLAPWPAKAIGETESIATVVHEQMTKAQREKTDLFSPLVGRAGVYFNPSNVAGDGYRLRAQMCFKKFAGYDFTNIENLAARYPVAPQAHSARLRIWRRSSMRGYMCWDSGGTGHWPALVAGFRNLYKAAHVYFVHEGGTAKSFAVSDVFDPTKAAHKTRFKNIIKNNVVAQLQDTAKMSLKSGHVWPWSDQDNFGWRYISPVNITPAQFYDKWLSPQVITLTWRAYRSALLLALVKEAEKRGYLRGHLFVEFKASPPFNILKYKCNNPTPHTYWHITKVGGARPANGRCPAPGCGSGPHHYVLSYQNLGFFPYRSHMPLPAVGIALGATWLFTNSNADTWTHEVGHHRHLEHAASAPGAQYAPRDPTDPVPNTDLHDAQDNEIVNWGALGETKGSQKDWDRYCIMSYASSNYPGGQEYFCGKCLLRNRGWKVQGIDYPGKKVAEPAP